MRLGGFTNMINARVVLLATIFCAATSFSNFRTGAMDEHSSMEVKYLRGDNETLVFNLRYENPFAKSVRLVALSESGDVWFQEKIPHVRRTGKKGIHPSSHRHTIHDICDPIFGRRKRIDLPR